MTTLVEPNDADGEWDKESFFRLSMDMLCIAGLDGYFKEVNPAFSATLGYRVEELLSTPFLEFVHPDDKGATLREMERLASGQPTTYFENRYRHKNGFYYTLSWTAFPAREGIVYAIARDITQQKNAMRTALAHLSDLLEQAPAAIAVVHGADHVYTLANPLYQKLFSRTEEQLIGKTIKEVFSEVEGQGIYEVFHNVFTSGIPYVANEFPATFDRLGNGTLETGYYNFVAQPIKDGQGQITDILVHAYEVTEQVVTRQKLIQQERQNAVIEERQRFARELHDAVSQALFSATTIAESLPNALRVNPERALALMESVVTLNRAAMAEMRTLLLELRPEAIVRASLRELFQQLLTAVRGQKPLQTELIMEGEEQPLEPEVHIAFYRIVQEAINNVMKHSKAKRLFIYYSTYPDKTVIRIHDDGQGFDTNQIASGMGLNNMRERAEAVGATLELASSVGEGTTILLQKQRRMVSTS